MTDAYYPRPGPDPNIDLDPQERNATARRYVPPPDSPRLSERDPQTMELPISFNLVPVHSGQFTINVDAWLDNVPPGSPRSPSSSDSQDSPADRQTIFTSPEERVDFGTNPEIIALTDRYRDLGQHLVSNRANTHDRIARLEELLERFLQLDNDDPKAYMKIYAEAVFQDMKLNPSFSGNIRICRDKAEFTNLGSDVVSIFEDLSVLAEERHHLHSHRHTIYARLSQILGREVEIDYASDTATINTEMQDRGYNADVTAREFIRVLMTRWRMSRAKFGALRTGLFNNATRQFLDCMIREGRKAHFFGNIRWDVIQDLMQATNQSPKVVLIVRQMRAAAVNTNSILRQMMWLGYRSGLVMGLPDLSRLPEDERSYVESLQEEIRLSCESYARAANEAAPYQQSAIQAGDSYSNAAEREVDPADDDNCAGARLLRRAGEWEAMHFHLLETVSHLMNVGDEDSRGFWERHRYRMAKECMDSYAGQYLRHHTACLRLWKEFGRGVTKHAPSPAHNWLHKILQQPYSRGINALRVAGRLRYKIPDPLRRFTRDLGDNLNKAFRFKKQFDILRDIVEFRKKYLRQLEDRRRAEWTRVHYSRIRQTVWMGYGKEISTIFRPFLTDPETRPDVRGMFHAIEFALNQQNWDDAEQSAMFLERTLHVPIYETVLRLIQEGKRVDKVRELCDDLFSETDNEWFGQPGSDEEIRIWNIQCTVGNAFRLLRNMLNHIITPDVVQNNLRDSYTSCLE